jgi:hypothetical protein
MARQYHWWIISKDETGRPYVIYGAPDFGSSGGEDVARTKAFDMLGGIDFELKRLATRNLDAARAFIAGSRLEKGMGLRESTRRQGHEKSLARLRDRIARRRSVSA